MPEYLISPCTKDAACSFVIISNPDMRRQFNHHKYGVITEMNILGLAGCQAAYKHGDEWLQELLSYLKSNRDLMENFIKEEMPEIKHNHMEATYLAWLDVSGLNLPDPQKFFEKAGVGLHEGKSFGNADFLRLNFGCPQSVLQQGLERMRKALRNR